MIGGEGVMTAKRATVPNTYLWPFLKENYRRITVNLLGFRDFTTGERDFELRSGYIRKLSDYSMVPIMHLASSCLITNRPLNHRWALLI